MRHLLSALFLLLIAIPAAFAAVCDDWNTLDKAIRDGKIDRHDARQKIIALDKQLLETGAGKIGKRPLQYPVKGYGPKGIGGRHGSDYQPSGYDFYDGNRHGGHPAHDLFIHDTRRSGLEDATGKPAKIVAFTGGIVIAVNTAWEYPSPIRGGKYIWIFNPENNRYYYYAHLAKIYVAPGDIVQADDTIALLGRTGKNARPKRSPTHLHFMCLSFNDGKMTPCNTYRELLKTETQ